MEPRTVFISTVGTGSRLGELTKYINKSLLTVGTKPVISHIISKFPADSKFVITVGYLGELVEEYLSLAHPEMNIKIVHVDKYEGPGSGLGYSMKCAKQFLQEPFYFCSCDTLFSHPVPEGRKENWIGIADSCGVEHQETYRKATRDKEGRCTVLEKHVPSSWIYTGLAYIHDFRKFWEGMENADVELGEVPGLNNIPLEHRVIHGWKDTGCVDGYQKASRQAVPDVDICVLPKQDEALWVVGDKVIKFFSNPEIVKNRLIRAEKLKGFVPEIEERRTHMYVYKFVPGKTLSTQMTLPVFVNLLEAIRNMWGEEIKVPDFQKQCLKFYKDKTEKRIKQYFKRAGRVDQKLRINGILHWELKELMKHIPWEVVCEGWPVRFHGDLHNENILYDGKKFTFLDWRQDFEGSVEYGDGYYDLAKLLHGLIVSHDIIRKGIFDISIFDSEIMYTLYRKDIMVKCEQGMSVVFGHSFPKIKILTALIFLNICGLHEFPYGHMLYALGVEMLQSTLISMNLIEQPEPWDL